MAATHDGLVIAVNPARRAGGSASDGNDIADTIGRAFPFDEAIIKVPGDATLLTREALRGGAERAIAMGGDARSTRW
jgi:hypothetical protein